jgi:methyl halide transferase
MPVSDAAYWSERYRLGQTAWDLGSATPVFAGLLHARRFPPGRMLVPGCGSGHDAVAFAAAGFDVVAMDIAPEAIDRAQTLARSRHVPVTFMTADIFTLDRSHDAAFDYVLEYVTWCAIEPSRLPEYASVIGRVLKPGGLLIALLFPVEQRTGGPPFAVDLDEVETLLAPAFRNTVREYSSDTISPRRGREVLTVWERLP